MTRFFRVLPFVVLALLLIGAAATAWGHDIYHHWKVPANPNVSCCDNTDCRPTRAYLGEDGLWRAWNGTEWLTVPLGALLPTDYAKDGRSHLCEKAGYVFCFSPGDARF